MLTILIDIDDTIEYLCATWVEWLDKKYNLDVKYDDITEWNMRVFFPSLTEDQIYEPLHTDSFWGMIKPIPDAIPYVKKLIDDGHNVYLCTSTDYRNVKPKFELIIKRYFPYINWNQVIVAQNKQMINADILVDDGVHNLIGGNYFGILFTAPHNKSCNTDLHGLARANNWQEVYNIITLYNSLKEKSNERG